MKPSRIALTTAVLRTRARARTLLSEIPHRATAGGLVQPAQAGRQIRRRNDQPAHTVDLLIEAGYAWFGNGLADDVPHHWVTDMASAPVDSERCQYYYHCTMTSFFCFFRRKAPVTGTTRIAYVFRNWRAECDAPVPAAAGISI